MEVFEEMIKLPNIDGKIWDIEQKIIDIVSEISTHGSCKISLNQEGPCAQSLGLYDLLDHVCESFSVKKDRFEIITCNQLEFHPEYRITIQPPLYINETQEFYRANHDRLIDKSFDDIKPVGIFIGRSNFLRLELASAIDRDYQDRAALTFHYDSNLEFHRPHCGIEDLIKHGYTKDQVSNALDFLFRCPKKFLEEKISYPILTPGHLDICQYYRGFFCEIVCETYFTGNSFYPTEKIWRPLLMKTPFIVQGPMYYLDNLKRLGFKTFDQWWDEGHQHDPYDYQPVAILEIVKQLMSLSPNELHQRYIDMLPTLQHNHDRFVELRQEDFSTVFGYNK